MELLIKINLDNAVFADSLTYTGLQRVLQQVYKIVDLPGWPMTLPNEYDRQFKLRDSNGNTVGTVEVK